MNDEYRRRLAARQEAAIRHDAQFRNLGNYRLGVVALGGVLAWYFIWTLPLAVAAFTGLIIWHERVAKRAAIDARAIRLYTQGLARLEGKWPGNGESGSRFQSPHHPYAGDLDIFGDGSVFQLINCARTITGEETLAQWLLSPSKMDETVLRHQAVQELSSRLDLREDLALLGDDVRAQLHAKALLSWGAAPPEMATAMPRWIAGGLSGGLLVSFLLFMLQVTPLWPVLLFLLGELVFFTLMRQPLGRILEAMEVPGRDLGVLSALMRRLETETFSSALLRALLARMQTKGRPASEQIALLRRLIEFRDQARNQMFAIVVEPLLWSMHFGFAIEQWRQLTGPHLGDWLAAVGELEALASLAQYASEHPDDVYPELREDGPVFEGDGVAHPLLGTAGIQNDVRLDGTMQLLLVSGSNMSGKSTLMRAVGLNAVLAWAGAPVRARRLSISRLSVGASMRVQDNLMEGASRFYAEITRLRQIVDMAGGQPTLLFLLDELLSGTNSHDRLIGSEAVVRTLVARGAIGLVSTHDLALAHIAEELAPLAANVHFQDHINNGSIAFDYRMRPGVVQKSNAIELMRSVGLEI
ncbi:MAG: DNA mismatch repair protein MutS [Bryobacteraceae bacterium]|nr:DNA mismatch repair protein MutS [Bryobacteraceae bacterium]